MVPFLHLLTYWQLGYAIFFWVWIRLLNMPTLRRIGKLFSWFSDCQSDAMKLRVCCLTLTRCWGRVQTTFCYQVRSHPPTTNHLRPHQTTLHPSSSTHSTVTVHQGQLLRLSTPGRESLLNQTAKRMNGSVGPVFRTWQFWLDQAFAQVYSHASLQDHTQSLRWFYVLKKLVCTSMTLF